MEIVNITILEAADMLCNYNTEKLLGLKEIMESFTCTIIPRCFHFWACPNFLQRAEIT
jgi:hypothetical protein